MPERRSVEEECRRLFGDYYVDNGSREWWMQQAMLERDSLRRAEGESTEARHIGGWGRECAIVALRMVARAGKLKAITPDETKVLEWADREPALHQPGANKRLGTPDVDYDETANRSARCVLFANPSRADR